MIRNVWKAFTRWFLPDYGITNEQRKSRNRSNIQALAGVALIVGPIFLGIYTDALLASVAMYVGLFWGLPILITMHLGESRGRTGWMWGFWLGWLGVLILACMSKPSAPTMSDPQMRELELRELEVRELEAKVRLAELRQAGQEQ